MSSNSDATLRSRKRRRPATSCDECHRRKTRCDRNQPCARCVLRDIECCFEGRTADRVSRAAIATSPVVSVASQVRSRRSVNTDDGASLPHLPTPTSENSAGLETRYQSIDEHQRDHRLDVGFEEQLAPESHRAASVRPYSREQPCNHASALASSHRPQEHLTLNKSRLFGQTHWSHGGHEFKKIGSIMRGEAATTTDSAQISQLKAEIQALLRKCKVLATRLKNDRPDRCPEACNSASILSFRSMSGALAENLAHLYITRSESVFRIVHIPSFWKDFTEHRSSNSSVGAVYHQIQLAMAIGSSIYRGEDADVDTLHATAVQSIHDAQSWLSAPLEKNRVNLQALQMQCMLILARHVLSVGGDLIWISMGSLVRTAIQMGLHRDPKHYHNMSLLDCELRRRLWGTILELDLQAALDSGTPPSISLDDFDTDAPANLDDTSLNEALPHLEPSADEGVTDASLQRFLITNLPTRLEIVRNMNSIEPRLKQDRLVFLSAEIEAACRRCALYIKDSAESDVGRFKHNMADLLLRRFILPLCRPYSNAEQYPELNYLARRCSVNAATTLLSPLPTEDFEHIILCGGGLFKNRIISITLALCSEVLSDLENRDPSQTLMNQQPSIFRTALIDALHDAINQCARRIQCGESNVRMHMKASIVLVLAKSQTSDTPIQQQMVQAAKDSLEDSCRMLQNRADLRASHGWSADVDMCAADYTQFHVEDPFNFDGIFFDGGLSDFPEHGLTIDSSHSFSSITGM